MDEEMDEEPTMVAISTDKEEVASGSNTKVMVFAENIENAENPETEGSDECDSIEKQDQTEEEWPGCTGLTSNKYVGSFLIVEGYRLVPFLKDGTVKFHPYDMPDIILGKVDIIGMVLQVADYRQWSHLQLDINDGTGSIPVKYKKDFIQKDKDTRSNMERDHLIRIDCAKNNPRWYTDTKKWFKIPPRFRMSKRPGTKYPESLNKKCTELLDTIWAVKTENGLIGEKIRELDYVRMWGYFSLDFASQPIPTSDISFDCLSMSTLLFYASRIICISEEEYHFQFKQRFRESMRNRYVASRNRRS